MGTYGRRWLRDGKPVPEDKKWCNGCKQVKAKTDFHRNRARADGLVQRCAACSIADDRKRLQAKPGGVAAHRRQYRYGITHEEYEATWAAQDGRCAACADVLERGGRMTHLDHCHTTKKVRGILCLPCNLALGYLRDDPDRIDALNAYLSRAA